MAWPGDGEEIILAQGKLEALLLAIVKERDM